MRRCSAFDAGGIRSEGYIAIFNPAAVWKFAAQGRQQGAGRRVETRTLNLAPRAGIRRIFLIHED
jgi:hypothetical protein